MALSDYKLNFTKNWENPDDFATYEKDEAQVRADIQLLYDEIRNAYNNFLDHLNALELPFSQTAEIAATTIQAAIENVQTQIAEATTGTIPDNSLETIKYKDGSVTFAKLGADVTPANLGAAAAVHQHDAQYYTKTAADDLLADKQNRTALLPQLSEAVADSDTFPMHDLSEASGRKITWQSIKAALKTYFDTVYGTLLNAHATRHAADGADPITVTVGNLAADAVTFEKIAAEAVSKDFTVTIPVKVTVGEDEEDAWAFDGPPYKQEKTVTGIVAEDTDHPITWVVNSGATRDQLTFVASTDKITVTTTEVFTGEISVTAVQSNTPYNFTLAAADWKPTAAPMKQEVTVTGLLATDEPFIDLVPDASFETAEKQIESFGVIYRAVAGADKLTLYATDTPDVAVPVRIKAVRK